ncbi:Uncharacterized protein FKW44_002539 [Caligus rogercresseyi]|uniref:Uncharacterized protein n=1 Tax=Caligus rogercresseyi TaxID=217165 RepID=A0A7T8KKD7_CALRO|nr:Uncharacterized protein FKW44_002539 [Caligus rogercresseyi]
MVIECKNKDVENARKLRDVDFINKVQKMVDEEPTKSYHRMPEDCIHTTVKDCIREDMHWRSYRKKTCLFLYKRIKKRRLVKSAKLLNKLKHPKTPGILCF